MFLPAGSHSTYLSIPPRGRSTPFKTHNLPAPAATRAAPFKSPYRKRAGQRLCHSGDWSRRRASDTALRLRGRHRMHLNEYAVYAQGPRRTELLAISKQYATTRDLCHLSEHRSPPSDWLPSGLCRKSVKKSVRKRLGHKMEADQTPRSIVPEGLNWAPNSPRTESLRRTAANPDYRRSDRMPTCWNSPPQLYTVALLPQAVRLAAYCYRQDGHLKPLATASPCVRGSGA